MSLLEEMKTERLTIRMSAKQKRDLAARAKRLGLSVAELVRRELDGMSVEEEAALDKLAEELEKNAEQLREAIQTTLKEIADTNEP